MFGFHFQCLKIGSVVGIRPSLELGVLRNRSIFSSFKCISSNANSNPDSFTVSYLMNSCGLSPEAALKASKHVKFETPEKPDSVISVLNNQGFSRTQISIIVKKRPPLLLSHPEKTILPKLQYLQSQGYSVSDIAEIVASSPVVLHSSLENQIIPSFNFLRDLLQSNEKVVTAIRRCGFIVKYNLAARAAPKINFLRDNGVVESSIVKLFYSHPRVLIDNVEKFKRSVEEAMKMGFHPSKIQFVEAVKVLMRVSKFTWESKVDLFKRWNLSEKEIIAAFRQQPLTMTKSEKKIEAVFDLFVNKLGWESSHIARCPAILAYSLEKRLVPRAVVLQYLIANGLVKKDFRNCAIFYYPDATFREKFVDCFGEATELLKLYDKKLALSR